MTLKTVFAIISLVFNFATFLPYYIGIWKKQTKPHLFSWIIWFMLVGLGFVLSYSSGGGFGAFTFALNSLLCLTIVVYALFKGEKNITPVDWIAFGAAVMVTIFMLSPKMPCSRQCSQLPLTASAIFPQFANHTASRAKNQR